MFGAELLDFGCERQHRRSRRPAAQSQGVRPRDSRAARSPSSRDRRARESRRSRSIRSTPRASAGTSSRCRPMRGSSSSGWRSPTSIPIEGLSPAVAIEQKNPTRRRARLSAPRPRSTTTCGCCGRASDAPLPRMRPRDASPTRFSRLTDTVLSLPPGTRFYVAFPLRLSDKVTHEVVVENLRAQGFLRVVARRAR